jgi:transposase-like protein
MRRKSEEQIVQKLPYRCPYCEQPITYDDLNLKPGENEITCPSCKRTYIKLVAPPLTEGDHGSRRQ